MARIKLDKDDVETIKYLANNTSLIDREIAQIFGVSRRHITAIRNKKRWNYEYGNETKQGQLETLGSLIKRLNIR
jgi:hypothetical protein